MEKEEMGKRLREEVSEEEEEEKPQEKRIRSDILHLLEDDDEVESTSDSGAEELVNAVMKSLQEEINGEEPPSTETDLGGLPDLGYLLEASDDELGLPPTGPQGNEPVVGDFDGTGSLDWSTGGCWDFDVGLPELPFPECGFAGFEEEEDDQVVVWNGLFDYSDYPQMGLWRPESMPAM